MLEKIPSSASSSSTTGAIAQKTFICSHRACGKSFTRAEHLRRHALNHEHVQDACPRCSVYFTRPDLLARHMARHAKKDEEAGGPGLGVLETRKRLWRAPDGTIMTKPRKRPPRDAARSSLARQPQDGRYTRNTANCTDNIQDLPRSPPRSLHRLSGGSSNEGDAALDEAPISLPAVDDLWNFRNDVDLQAQSHCSSQWTCHSPIKPQTNSQMSFKDIFNTDTANSFNIMPFTTNLNWLFDMTSSSPDVLSDDKIAMTGVAVDLIGTDSGIQVQEPSISTEDHLRNMDAQMINIDTSWATQDIDEPTPAYEGGDARLTKAITKERGQNTPHEDFQISGVYDGTCNSVPSVHHGNSGSHDIPYPEYEVGSTSIVSNLSPRKRQNELPVIDELSRDRILEIIDRAQPRTIDGVVLDRTSCLLSPSALQQYCDLFFTRFNMAYPLLHQATFDPINTDPLLLTAVLLLGATYSGKNAHQMAVGVHDVFRAQIIQHPSFNEQPDLWMLQAILLVDCFGTSRAGQKQHAMSNMFHGLLHNLIRRSDYHNIRTPSFDPDRTDINLDAHWKISMEYEQRKRLALLCFLWDTQHAVLFSQSSCLSAIELRLSLPCGPDIWEAPTAQDWHENKRRNPATLLFLTVLKAYLNPNTTPRPRNLDGFSRVLILHGLMSVSSDLKRRDQISLGIETGAGSFQDRMERSYNCWKADFETYCMDMKLAGGYNSQKFTPFRTATLAIYRVAQIALNVEVLDLQIFAGASHILGKAVKPKDFERSTAIIRIWSTLGEPRSALGQAAWHASRILRDAIMNLDEGDFTDLIHYPWCLYLASLTCWAFHSRGHTAKQPGLNQASCQSENTDPRSEMTALVVGMTSFNTVEDLNNQAGSYKTQGMIALMAKQLSSVRWAVIREGTKVLERLSQTRSNEP